MVHGVTVVMVNLKAQFLGLGLGMDDAGIPETVPVNEVVSPAALTGSKHQVRDGARLVAGPDFIQSQDQEWQSLRIGVEQGPRTLADRVQPGSEIICVEEVTGIMQANVPSEWRQRIQDETCHLAIRAASVNGLVVMPSGPTDRAMSGFHRSCVASEGGLSAVANGAEGSVGFRFAVLGVRAGVTSRQAEGEIAGLSLALPLPKRNGRLSGLRTLTVTFTSAFPLVATLMVMGALRTLPT